MFVIARQAQRNHRWARFCHYLFLIFSVVVTLLVKPSMHSSASAILALNQKNKSMFGAISEKMTRITKLRDSLTNVPTHQEIVPLIFLPAACFWRFRGLRFSRQPRSCTWPSRSEPRPWPSTSSSGSQPSPRFRPQSFLSDAPGVKKQKFHVTQLFVRIRKICVVVVLSKIH